MGQRSLWAIIFGLLVVNCLTVLFFLHYGEQRVPAIPTATMDTQAIENIAYVGDRAISREEWLDELEKRYGKETLKDMVDAVVIEELAKKYDLSLSEETLTMEMNMIKTMYNSVDQERLGDEEKLRKQIRTSILLEELLTKDVKISDEELSNYYSDNQELFEIPLTYHLAKLTVKSSEEAEQVKAELEGGSDFHTLAMERSEDEFSSNQGGDLGLIPDQSEVISKDAWNKISSLKQSEWTKPVLENGTYAFYYLIEKLPEVKYSFEDVLPHIRRQIALEQMSGKISADVFWKEAKASWFYDK